MSGLEDPIFDAWWIQCPAISSPQAAESEPDVTTPVVDHTDAGSVRGEQPGKAFRWGPAGFPTRRPRAARVAPLAPAVQESLVHAVALPRLRVFAQRLEAAGHEIIIDARLGEQPACVRMRLRPAPGPFDAPSEAGSVLEFVLEAKEPESVSARVWLDEFDTAPTEALRPPGGVLTEKWVDHVVVDFVGRALNRY